MTWIEMKHYKTHCCTYRLIITHYLARSVYVIYQTIFIHLNWPVQNLIVKLSFIKLTQRNGRLSNELIQIIARSRWIDVHVEASSFSFEFPPQHRSVVIKSPSVLCPCERVRYRFLVSSLKYFSDFRDVWLNDISISLMCVQFLIFLLCCTLQ